MFSFGFKLPLPQTFFENKFTVHAYYEIDARKRIKPVTLVFQSEENRLETENFDSSLVLFVNPVRIWLLSLSCCCWWIWTETVWGYGLTMILENLMFMNVHLVLHFFGFCCMRLGFWFWKLERKRKKVFMRLANHWSVSVSSAEQLMLYLYCVKLG